MPNFLRPDRGEVPQLGDPAFDALLARALPAEDAVASLRPLVESFAALYAAPVYWGAAAEATALAAFRGLDRGRAGLNGAGLSGAGLAGQRPHRSGRWVRSRLAGVRLTVAAAAVALTAGSAMAAYAGHLPAPVQRLAHTVIGAPPAAHGTPRPEPGRPGTPPVRGNAAYGLCRAYERAQAHGGLPRDSVTFRRLAAIAHGSGQVNAYCGKLAHPGNPASGQPSPSPHGKPPEQRTQHGNPSPAASHHGKPSARPTPAATHHGKPTG